MTSTLDRNGSWRPGDPEASPRRLSVTIGDKLYQRLRKMAADQGRSVSNLCAHLLSRAASDGTSPHPCVWVVGMLVCI